MAMKHEMNFLTTAGYDSNRTNKPDIPLGVGASDRGGV